MIYFELRLYYLLIQTKIIEHSHYHVIFQADFSKSKTFLKYSLAFVNISVIANKGLDF